MVRVDLFSVSGYACDFDGDRHVFSKPGSRIVVRHNGNLARPAAHADLVPRGATVERTRLRQLLPHALTGWGNNTNGNDQGGQGIDLQPSIAPDSQAALDGTIERHAVTAFRPDGMPLTRAELGYGFEYVPANDYPAGERIALFRGPLPLPQAGWQRIDPAHLCRAFNPAVVLWRERRDVVGFWGLQVVANDVMLSYADKLVPGDWSLAGILERTRTTAKGTAWFGELRAHAHSLRAVVEALRAYLDSGQPPSEWQARMRQWIVEMVEVVFNIQHPNGAMTMNDATSGQDQGAPWFIDQMVKTASRSTTRLATNETECVSWQAPYMLRALYEAHVVLRDPDTTRRVRAVVARWMQAWKTCELVEAEYSERFTLPKYLVVERAGTYLPTLNEGIGHGLSQWDEDSFQVARNMGVKI